MIPISSFSALLIFLSFSLGGALLEVMFLETYRRHGVKKTEGYFSVKRYLYLLTLPVIGVFFVSSLSQTNLAPIFFSFVIVGTILEYTIGFCYEKILGHKLWQYNQFPITGYTSWLSLPLWGLAGVLFWLLAKMFV